MYKIINKILAVFEENGLWEDGVELVGSWCFNLYQEHLGVKSYPLKTQDIDFLIPVPFKSRKHIDLVEELGKIGFQHSFNQDGSIYLWNAELKIEFLVPQKSKGDDKAIDIKGLSIKAIPLRFVNILLDHPITVEDNGINIRIPNPSAFCLQKIIVAFRRKKLDKRIKDLEQAIYVFEITNKNDLKHLFMSFPKPWQKAIIINLKDSKKLLPLLEDDISRILDTLQNTTI
ncbi:MAG: hypothetical protein A2297_01625 [Elusimicrobia bacterium RIFOXYB2_FULL_48_7]|nr:MAG: hypothetical protein A2297_01625 [Elusimicrobia bacterium RIFOXYB2_FULL_48_7]